MALTKEDKAEIAKMIAKAMGKEVWGDGVTTKKLKCGLEVALEDYCTKDEDGETKWDFTFWEVLNIESQTNGKWRAPTVSEWLQIVQELGTTDSGELDVDRLVEELRMTKPKDYSYDYGYNYWSSTANGDDNAYHFHYDEDGICPADWSNQNNKWLVRCVRNIVKQGGSNA